LAEIELNGRRLIGALGGGQEYTQAADWFSLGCVVFQLLTGTPPFRGGSKATRESIDRRTLAGVRGVVVFLRCFHMYFFCGFCLC
jgi:serine/threonine protein kinase